MSNAATSKPGNVEKECAKLELAPIMMIGKEDLQEGAIIRMNLRPELAITGTALTPFGCEEIVIKHGEREYRSAGKLVVPKLPFETMNDSQGLSGSGKNERDDEEKEDRQPEEPM